MKFNIPIVFQIKADTVEEAEGIAMNVVEEGYSATRNYDDALYSRVKGYGPGQFMLRIRKDSK